DECAPVDNSFDADVFANLAWIQAEGGADIQATACGDGPQIGGPGTTILNSIALYIRHGATASATAFDCKGDEPSGQQFCSVENPAPGTWYLLARHLS